MPFKMPFKKSASTSSSSDATKAAKPAFDEIKATDGKLKQFGAQDAKAIQDLPEQNDPLKFKIFEPSELISKLNIRPGFKVAEFGCGAGNIVLPLAKFAGQDVEVYGVDVQKDLLLKMLRQAKADGLKNVFAVWGDLDELGGSKLPDAQFDLVLIVNTLFQLEDKKVALQEAFRILKPGAHLCVVDWLDSGMPLGPHKEDLIPKASLIEMASEAGFLLSDESKLGEHHFKLDFNKKNL